MNYEAKQAVLLFQNIRRKCSVKKVFLYVSQKSEENTCARFSF